MEIVSRVMNIDEDWQTEITKIWEELHKNFYIETQSTCGTHVHLRPMDGFELSQLKNMAKVIAVFERNVRDAMPKERKDSKWAMSNVSQKELSPKLTQFYNQCRNSNDYNPLFRGIDFIISDEELSAIMSPGKIVTWNFRNVLNSCGTLEFRRPPQVVDAKSTCNWVAFALSFVSYALSSDFSNSNLTSPKESTHFQECIRQHARHLGMESALSDWHAMAQTIQKLELTSDDNAQITEQERKK